MLALEESLKSKILTVLYRITYTGKKFSKELKFGNATNRYMIKANNRNTEKRC